MTSVTAVAATATPAADVPTVPESFCLPFTVIDQAVQLLDTPAEPWGIQFEIGFYGGRRVDEAQFRSAVGEALYRHPMSRARRMPARQTDKTWTWEVPARPDLDPVRVVDLPLDTAREDLYGRQVPLVESPPLRISVVRRPDGDSVLLNANHAALDGFGCLRFLQSVASAYAGRTDPGPPVPLEEARDVRRLLAAPDRATRARRWRMLAEKASDLVVRTSRLAVGGGRDRPGYGFVSLALTAEETAALSVGDATVNDVLLAGLNLAIARWNGEHGAPARRIGVLVPVNLRPKGWHSDVVTNLVLDVRVLTTANDRADVPALLESIGEQSDRIKQGGGAALIETIGGWDSVPLWAKRPLSPLLWLTGNRLVCTALLSNLGPLKDPPDFGADLGTPSEAWFSAPGRMPCGLTVGALTVGDRLHLSLRFRHPQFDPAAASRFATLFRAALAEVAEAA